MAGTFRDRKLAVVFSGAFLRQSAFGVPLDPSDIDTRHPQLTPTYPGRILTREQIRDCSGEYVIREDITSRMARLRFSFDADPYLLGGWMALAQSLAAAPSGVRTAEVQTITPTGDVSVGTWTIGLTFEGITDTTTLPVDATAAEIKAGIESLRNVRTDGVTVVGTLATTVVITFANHMAAYNMPLFDIDDAGISSGGTLAIAETTPGASKISNISRTTSGQNAVTSLIVGFEDNETPPDLYKDIVVNELVIRGELRGKVSVELEVLGSLDLEPVEDFVIPECANITPVYTKDCRLYVDGAWVVSDLREFTYTYRNNIFTGDDSFPYDDIDVSRLEHGDRESGLDFTVYGSKGDALYAKAEAEQIIASQLILGRPANRLVVDIPKQQLQLADDPIIFAGEANRSAMAIIGPSRYQGGVAGSPDRAYYYGAETNTFISVP